MKGEIATLQNSIKDAPNILLIIMDAARADHLSCYGYCRKTTPNIDELANEGILFKNAFSAGAWTPPAVASLFTGKYPSEHGVMGYPEDVISGKGIFGENLYLSRQNVTLAEILSAVGYKTLGLSHTPHVSRIRGFSRGFKHFIEYYNKSLLSFNSDSLYCLAYNLIFGTDCRAVLVNRIIKKWLHKNSKHRFFIYAHYCNPHAPYNPPWLWKRKFKVNTKNLSLRIKKLKDSKCNLGNYYMAKKINLSEKEFGVWKSWYDAEISYLDYRIGELIDFLRKLDVYDNTVVIITADHGECFGEHGLAYHGYGLYDELIHIPLIINAPNLIDKKRKISNLVSIIDILPTILDLCNIETNIKISGGNLFHGREYIIAEKGKFKRLVRLFRKINPNFDPNIYIESKKCIRTERFKYILSSKEELYDLKKDPHETQNIIAEKSVIAKKMKDMLMRWEKSIKKPKFEWLQEEKNKIKGKVRKLRKIGKI